MIGGAPVNQAFSDLIGTDGYASITASVADLAKKFVSTESRNNINEGKQDELTLIVKFLESIESVFVDFLQTSN